MEDAAILYAAENLALLKIFIKLVNFQIMILLLNSIKLHSRDPFYTRIKIDQRITFAQFLGNVGGMLGLLTGLSVVSIVEIFYHLVITCKKMCSD